MSDVPSDSDKDEAPLSEDDDKGLFGSGSEDEETEEVPRKKRRRVDDPELDSGDDGGRSDRAQDAMDDGDGIPQRTAIVTDIAIGKHPGPLPSDGELYLLQFPHSITIQPKSFTLDGFEPPTSASYPTSSSSTFSAFAASNNTIRWRKSPSNHTSIQSNAKINRWSDGSLTLQIGSNAKEQFQLAAKSLAHPQIDPPKPTPTSVTASRAATLSYNQASDTHTYLASPHELAGLMRNSHQITTSLAVHSTEQDDDALIRLQEGMAAAVRGNKATANGGVEIISIKEDPENAKRRAELAEKEKARMQRRYQNQQDRESTRANNVLKRAGLRTGAGLTVGGLEGDDSLGTVSRKTKAPKRSRRRMDEYSDEDDFSGRRRTKEDEYDEDDGFLVGSDEEPEVDGASEEEEEEDADLDAEGEDDEQPVSQKANPGEAADDAIGGGYRQKRRRVIEDEEED